MPELTNVFDEMRRVAKVNKSIITSVRGRRCASCSRTIPKGERLLYLRSGSTHGHNVCKECLLTAYYLITGGNPDGI